MQSTWTAVALAAERRLLMLLLKCAVALTCCGILGGVLGQGTTVEAIPWSLVANGGAVAAVLFCVWRFQMVLKEQREDSRLEREQVRLDASRERTETRGQFAQSLKDVVADFGSRVETSNDRVEAWMRDLTNEMRAQRGLPPRPPEGAT